MLTWEPWVPLRTEYPLNLSNPSPLLPPHRNTLTQVERREDLVLLHREHAEVSRLLKLDDTRAASPLVRSSPNLPSLTYVHWHMIRTHARTHSLTRARAHTHTPMLTDGEKCHGGTCPCILTPCQRT